MATPANRLFRLDFDGTGYPTFDVWPDFEFPASGQVNANGRTRPVCDGHGYGLASRQIGGVTWRAKATAYPGRVAFQTGIRAKWKNAGFAGRRECGLIIRYVDADNVLVARLRSMGTASPELRLFKVVAGVETQLGATYTGSAISAAVLNAGAIWRARVEDLDNGDTRVTVYTDDGSNETKGDARIDYTGDLSAFRGLYTVGVELRDQVYLDDVLVDYVDAYDLADEWDAGGGSSYGDGSGWIVEFGDTAYTMAQLAALSPPVSLVSVKQAYGLKGNVATFRVDGDWRMGSVVKPGVAVRVLHNGAVRFRGWIAEGTLAAQPAESQVFSAFDAYWEARKVIVTEDDKTGTHFFNVTDDKDDNYNRDRVDLTIGEVIRFHLDRYLPILRRYGIAPSTGDAYVVSELNALDAVIPDLSTTTNLVAAVEVLLAFMPKFQVWVDPIDLVWHFRDVTALAGESISCAAEWVTFSVKPDRDKAYTAVVWRGARKETDEPVTMSIGEGTLKPAWNKAQEDAYGKDKRKLDRLDFKVLSAGTAICPKDGVMRPFIDLAASHGLDEDDWRGAICGVDGDAYPRLVVTNTSTRIWLSAPAWGGGTPPSPGALAFLSGTDPEAIPELMASGVGRGFVMFPPAQICGYAPVGVNLGLKLKGWCGQAEAFTQGEDGKTYREQYAYQVRMRSQFQQDAGFCDTTVVLAEKPLKPISLINFVSPPGGSPPKGICLPGPMNQPSQTPIIDVKITVPKVKEDAPYFREPEGDDVWTGDAFTEWGVRQEYVVDDPDFVDAAQVAGLRKAAQAFLALKSQLPYALTARIASPWRAGASGSDPFVAAASSTARFAGLSKRVNITSATRVTGLDATTALMLFAVEWQVEEDATIIEAGTASGWLNPIAQNIAKTFSEARVLKKAAGYVKQLADFLNTFLAKNADVIAGQPNGPTDGCEVELSNQTVKRRTTVEADDQDKVDAINHATQRGRLAEDLLFGRTQQFPGDPLDRGGLSGSPAQQAIDGAVLRPLVDPELPFPGPPVGANGDRSRYGGAIGADDADAFSAPDELFRRGNYAFRKAAAADGRRQGGAGYEFSPLDGAGRPTGVWSPWTGPESFPGGRVPLSMVEPGSLVGQTLARATALAAKAGAVVSPTTGKVLDVGDRTDPAYPHGVPADLVTTIRAGGGLLGPYFKPVAESFGDKGGMVYRGPFTEDGADAGLFWRVHPDLVVPCRVEAVTPGTGTNGGAWAWSNRTPGGVAGYTGPSATEADTDAAGLVLEYMTAGYVVHKQVHGDGLYRDRSAWATTASTPAATDDPFCFYRDAGMTLPGGMGVQSGAGAIIPLPLGARGVPMFSAHLREEIGNVDAVGATVNVRLAWSYKASDWGVAGSGTTAAQNPPVADGAGTGTGQFKAPGGAIPPGLRVPSDVAVSVQRNGSLGTMTGGATLTGIGMDVAVVEGGFAVLWRESPRVGDVWSHLSPATLDTGELDDAWRFEFTRNVTEALEVEESWQVELNPALSGVDDLDLADAWTAEVL